MKVAVITASDRSARGERPDKSGPLLVALLEEWRAPVIHYEILPDDVTLLRQTMKRLSDEMGTDVILTTGGTGLGPHDVTPEATRPLIEREIPGIAEAMRLAGSEKTPFAMLSRGFAGVRGQTLIVNLPGSPEAVKDAFKVLEPVLAHVVELIQGKVKDCHSSLSSLLPS